MERIISEVIGPYSPKKLGVGAIVINQEGKFLAVQETHSRRDNRKMIGMWSHPMETLEKDEEYEDALRRLLFGEEVENINVRETSLASIYLGRVQLSLGIWLHNFLLHTDDNEVRMGKAADVSQLAWFDPKEAYEAPVILLSKEEKSELPQFLNPVVRIWVERYLTGLDSTQRVSLGSLKWRPGVRESIHSYLEYLKDPDRYIPKSYPVTIDDFPPEIILEEYKEEDKEK